SSTANCSATPCSSACRLHSSSRGSCRCRGSVLAELCIDLRAIRRNAAALSALIAPSRLVPVVKANGYGHGLAAVALALAPQTGRIAVYELAEAIALRDAGITNPIQVLGPIAPGELETADAAGVELT